MDPPHLIKLTRNTLGDLGVLVDRDGNFVKWEYIRSLHILQKTQGLHLANKLTPEHIDYKKNKMKVKLATQVCSQSVANALIHCSLNLKLPEFKGAEYTAEFLKCFDLLFDTMNSRFSFGKYSKAPLAHSNAESWKSALVHCEKYILGLKHTDGKRVLNGARKAAFIGWLNDIKCLRIMFENYVETRILKYILVFKMSQDPLELFFGSIRASLGYNNNPTVLQFERAYIKLCAGALIKAGKGSNCLWDDSTTLLCGRDIKISKEDIQKETNDEPKSSSITSLDNMVIHPLGNNELRTDILTYISGNTQRKVSGQIECQNCLKYLRKPHILAPYLDFEGAENIHVLKGLIWGFGGHWRFLNGVWHLDLDFDMVIGLL